VNTAKPLHRHNSIRYWGKTENFAVIEYSWMSQGGRALSQRRTRYARLILLFSVGTNGWTQKTLQFQTGSTTNVSFIYAKSGMAMGTFWMA